MAGLRILGALAVAAIAALAATAPAQAQIMGDLPTVKLVEGDGDTFLQVSGFLANRGLVQATASDRFAFRTSVTVGAVSLLKDDPLLADKDASIKQGSEVALLPVVYDVTGLGIEVGDAAELTASLVVTDAAGSEHVLDTLTFGLKASS